MNILQEIRVPHESVNDEFLTVLEFFVKEGERVKPGTMLLELETSKATISVEADKEGFAHFCCRVGDEVPINGLLVQIGDQPVAASTQQSQLVDATSTSTKPSHTIFSKAAEELIKQHKLDSTLFADRDFVSSHDVMAHLGVERPAQVNGVTEPMQKKGSTKAPAVNVPVEWIKVSSFKKREIQYLSDVQSAGLVSTLHIRLELQKVWPFLDKRMKYFKKSILPIVVFECGKLLQRFPLLNAFFNGDQVGCYQEVHVGFAVDLGDGLKVIRVPQTSTKTLAVIEDEIFELSNKYVDQVLTPADLSDITFTITDLSTEGVDSFIPLINARNSAILGISAANDAQQMELSLSFDHRVTEGKYVAEFLRELKQRVESYSTTEEEAVLQAGSIRCYKCRKTMSEDLSDVGFMKCITPRGTEAFICQACLKGF